MPAQLNGLLRIGAPWMRSALLLTLLVAAFPIWTRGQTRVALGNATVELTGPWRFHAGDDPAWAMPDFDDSQWGTLDLTPPDGSYDPYLGAAGFVPGWTARGYGTLTGYAWYRLNVSIDKGPAGWTSNGLALKMPHGVDDAYQVFANGVLIGEFGHFSETGVSNYVSQPRAFALPPRFESGPVTFAVRMWMDPHTPLIQPRAGGMHGPPVLGSSTAVYAMLRLDWDMVNHSTFTDLAEAAILLLALAVAFTLFAMDRSEAAYVWLGVNCVVTLVWLLARALAYHTTWISAAEAVILRDVILQPAGMALWVEFWACWFRLWPFRSFHRIVWGLSLVQGLGMVPQRAPLYGHLVPVDSTAWLSAFTLLVRLMLVLVLFWVIYRGIRANRTEGLVALPAVVLLALAQYQYVLALFVLFVGGYSVAISQIAIVLSLGIITVLLLRRFLQAQRERQQWRVEMEQAHQVQHVLIPEHLPTIPGFALESEYRPALRVGGDFFQILATPDGGVLAIIGDVSGKGLQAAMLVSLIVGATRTLTAFTHDPAEILRGINDRLCGRLSNQFATCLAVHVAPSGRMSVANAGHQPPLWNGRELEMAGGIPLGIVEATPIEQMSDELRVGDRLLLLTDGVAEARNRRKELFGFHRVEEMAERDCSSEEIAAAAQEFGQEDDITVLRLERVA